MSGIARQNSNPMTTSTTRGPSPSRALAPDAKDTNRSFKEAATRWTFSNLKSTDSYPVSFIDDLPSGEPLETKSPSGHPAGNANLSFNLSNRRRLYAESETYSMRASSIISNSRHPLYGGGGSIASTPRSHRCSKNGEHLADLVSVFQVENVEDEFDLELVEEAA